MEITPVVPPRTVWVVSDGRAGIERQALALAHALADAVTRGGAHAPQILIRRVDPRPPQVWLPARLWWSPLGALTPARRHDFAPPWPDVWIGCGRRSVPYSIAVRHWSQARTFVVQCQHPRVPAALFDLVVPPEHDRLDGPNVLPIVGAPVWFDKVDAGATGARTLLVAVGGPSASHAFGPDTDARLIAMLGRARTAGWDLRVTTSRRTPAHTLAALVGLRDKGVTVWTGTADGPNPYAAWLATSHAALVTADSTNLLCDAAWFGLPITLFALPARGTAAKFGALADRLEALGHLRRGEDPAIWPAPRLRESPRVAAAILDAMATAALS